MKYEFPETYGQDCIIVAIDKSLVPMISGALRRFEWRATWVNDADYEQGYNAFAQIQADLMNNCLTQLVESHNRLYRLLDTALNGTTYTAQEVNGQLEISPAIADVPPASVNAANALRAHVGRLWHLAENSVAGVTAPAGAGVVGAPALGDNQSERAVLRAMQGIINAGLFGIGGQPATFADMVMAMRAGSEGDIERVTTALDILSGASSGATVFNTVRDLLTDTASVTAEGGILAVLIASTMSQAALMGLQGAQLDTLIASLNRLVASTDGGATPAPTTNVIAELQGVNEKLV